MNQFAKLKQLLLGWRKPQYPLDIKRHQASLLDPEFVAMLRFVRNSEDVMEFNLATMSGFKWRSEVESWLVLRNCRYDVNLKLRPHVSGQNDDVMTITFALEQDRVEFKLTFL
jgi:hypothetical protein